jgi:hypothetical protein
MRSLLLFISFFLCCLAGFAQTDFYSSKWSSVYKHEINDLPKSAVAVVDSIYVKAKKDNNFTQVVRALVYQSKFAMTLEEDAELKVVQKFQKEISEARSPIRNILESMLAEIYTEYFKMNRYQMQKRTRTAEKVDSIDFRTWDEATLLREIDVYHQRALHEIVILKQNKLAPFDEILTRADNSRRYRPTLFDLLAHQALDFYRSGELSDRTHVNAFKLDNPQYATEFESLTLPRHDTLSPLYRTMKLYQQLLSFHKRDRDQSAYVDVELERLEFVIQQGTFADKAQIHKQTLRNLQTRYSESPLSAMIAFELANVLNTEALADESMSFKEAIDVCEEAIRRYPVSDAGMKCKVLLEGILDPRIELKSERYIPSGKPSLIYVSYQNTDSIRFRVYKISDALKDIFEDLTKDSERIEFMDSLATFKDWSSAFKIAGDYRMHSTEIVVPPLDHGLYLVRANIADGDKEKQARFLAYSIFTVTDIALITTSIGRTERFQVVNRVTGAPIAGAQVYIHNNPSTEHADKIERRILTDKDGLATVDAGNDDWYNVHVKASFGNDTLYHYENYLGDNNPRKEDKEDEIIAKAFLFTDRSIYRPGQTVYYKGIFVQTKGKKTSIVPNEYVEVWMEDVNGEEYDRKRLKTNSFGSFHGEFKLPSGGLTGEYSINVEEDMESESDFYESIEYMDECVHEFSVEEYKRP